MTQAGPNPLSGPIRLPDSIPPAQTHWRTFLPPPSPAPWASLPRPEQTHHVPGQIPCCWASTHPCSGPAYAQVAANIYGLASQHKGLALAEGGG